MAKGTHITMTELENKLADLDFVPICDEEIGAGMHRYYYLSRYGIPIMISTRDGDITEVEAVTSCKCSTLEE